MRIKSYKFLSYILCFLLLLSGCSLPENAQGDSSDEKQQTINEGSDDLFPSVYTASDIGIQNLFLESGEVINRMEIDSDGNLYVFASNDSGEEIFISMKNGQEKREILDDYLGFIYYDEAREVFYTYNSIKNCIEVRNQDFEIDKLLLLDFCPFEIKEMLVRGNKLYILSIDENPYELDDTEYIFEEDDYTDFGEKLWAISLENGERKNLEIEGLISMCGQKSGYIYLYVHRDGSYYLEVYDPLQEKIIHSEQTDSVGYLFSMAVIGRKMYYTSPESNGIWVYDINGGNVKTAVSGVFTLSQSDFDIYGDTLIYLDRSNASISAFNTKLGKISSADGKVKTPNENSDVIIGISSIYNLQMDVSSLESLSGLSIGMYQSSNNDISNFDEHMMTKLMAGDTDVDIVILFLTVPYNHKLSMDGVCYPLNDSEIISQENSSYFDNISAFFKTESGNIWGIPLSSYTDVIAAIPENMTRNGYSTEIFKDYRTFMESLKSVKKHDGIFIWGENYGFDIMRNYISNVGSPDYCSDEYRYFFESMWSGWKRYDDMGYANNPYLGTAKKTITIDGKEEFLGAAQNAFIMDPENMLFHMIDENSLIDYASGIDNLEVYKIPLLSASHRNGIGITKVAIVNPNGKNRDNAVKLLEKISEKLHLNDSLGVVYKDENDYPEKVKANPLVFKQIYDINKDSIVLEAGIINDLIANEVASYQEGSIDLDTCLTSMQRKEDAYRNE